MHSVSSAGSDTVMLWGIVLLLGLTRAADPLPDDAIAGPNVCSKGGRSFCCPGWRRQPGSASFCIIPVCSRSCGDGKCVRPNLCVCASGQLAPFCPPSVTAVPNGVHGNVTPPQQPSGPNCKEPCLNGGRCIGADRCACIYGYTGRRCERDYRTGPCFRKVQNQFCAGQLDGVVCTRQLCCATIGVAWGHPCERCPSKMNCDRGFITDSQGGTFKMWTNAKIVPSARKDVAQILLAVFTAFVHKATIFHFLFFGLNPVQLRGRLFWIAVAIYLGHKLDLDGVVQQQGHGAGCPSNAASVCLSGAFHAQILDETTVIHRSKMESVVEPL